MSLKDDIAADPEMSARIKSRAARLANQSFGEAEASPDRAVSLIVEAMALRMASEIIARRAGREIGEQS